MHPVLVKTLPASFRRAYYEFVDYQLPLLLDVRYWTGRLVYNVHWLISGNFRKREAEQAKQLADLQVALQAGYGPRSEFLGEPLRVESLAPVMELVTFEDRRIITKKRFW